MARGNYRAFYGLLFCLLVLWVLVAVIFASSLLLVVEKLDVPALLLVVQLGLGLISLCAVRWVARTVSSCP